MKYKLPLIAAIVGLTAVPSLANDWQTLSGVRDEVTLKSGETALVVAVSGRVTVRYEKPSNQRTWFRLRSDDSDCFGVSVNGRCSDHEAVVSTARPFPLAGPATIALSTPGVATLQIVRPAPEEATVQTAVRRPRVISPRWQQPGRFSTN